MQDNNSTKNNETQKRENPFFLPYGTPHYTVPFHRIQLGDYEEAFYHEYLRRLDGLYDSIPTVICHGLYCHFSGKEKEQPVIGFTYLG